MSFAIRDARPDDVPAILGLIRALAAYEKLAHEVVATEELLREALFGARPWAEVLVAERAGAGSEAAGASAPIVGFALHFPTFSTFLARPGIWLEDLFVLPEHRGAGLGRALLARLAAIAVARGCGRLEWSVLDWNEPALRFYARLGARRMDDWTTHRLAGDALAALARGA